MCTRAPARTFLSAHGPRAHISRISRLSRISLARREPAAVSCFAAACVCRTLVLGSCFFFFYFRDIILLGGFIRIIGSRELPVNLESYGMERKEINYLGNDTGPDGLPRVDTCE